MLDVPGVTLSPQGNVLVSTLAFNTHSSCEACSLFGCWRSAGFVLAFALCFLGWSLLTYAQDPHCDRDLEKLAERRLPHDDRRYRLGGDRCEGKYIEQVSSSTLELVSFTSAFADYSLVFRPI